MKRSKATYGISVWVALGLVYIVWGSIYMAIRFAVQTIPPFLGDRPPGAAIFD